MLHCKLSCGGAATGSTSNQAEEAAEKRGSTPLNTTRVLGSRETGPLESTTGIMLTTLQLTDLFEKVN